MYDYDPSLKTFPNFFFHNKSNSFDSPPFFGGVVKNFDKTKVVLCRFGL